MGSLGDIMGGGGASGGGSAGAVASAADSRITFGNNGPGGAAGVTDLVPLLVAGGLVAVLLFILAKID